MKANLTRGNSITDFTDWIEECIYNEIKEEYYKQLEIAIKKDNERRLKEFMGNPDSKPIGIFTYPHSIGIRTDLIPQYPIISINDFFSA